MQIDREELEKEVEKHSFAIVSLGYSNTEVVAAVISFAEAFSVVVSKFQEMIKSLSDNLSDALDFFEDFSELAIKKEKYKLDLKRPLIRDQVIERKPRHLIKKIIQ